MSNELTDAEKAELEAIEAAEKKAAEEKAAAEKAELEAKSKKQASFKALKKFYYRIPCKGGEEKVISKIGEIIPAKFITKEIIEAKLVEKV